LECFIFLHSLKLTAEVALWGIFSFATKVTLLLPPLVLWQKICGTGVDGSNLYSAPAAYW